MAERNNIRVFTSTTFRDMVWEREALAQRIFPQLREECISHGVVLTDVDLRLGISEETSHKTFLETVKSELNRAAVMISVLGERFGWIPADEYDSVTALEMYTALASPAMRLLVFRREAALTRELAMGLDGSIFLSEPELEQRKLIRRLDHLGVVMTPYSSIDQFTALVTERLRAVLTEMYFSKWGNVFISYSRKNVEKAMRLKQLLEGLGFNVWLDLVGIAAGEEWPAKLAEAIKEADVVLMLLSRASVSSEYCLKEVIFAKKKNKPIVGLRLEDMVLPDKIELMLGDAQQVAMPEDQGFESVVEELAHGLRMQIQHARQTQCT
jgi:hypothetical protein